jgi:two-component system phosphate regulon sensor histidine kinase PhoR
MRRDFVANVSHELRTPLSAIRAAVETLLDGALQDPRFSRQFSEVIQRHVLRLQDIVEDLLNLARLENRDEHRSERCPRCRRMARVALETVSAMAEKTPGGRQPRTARGAGPPER